MILELANNISAIWPNQLQNRTQKNAHARVYNKKKLPCYKPMEFVMGGATRVAPPQSSSLHSGVLG